MRTYINILLLMFFMAGATSASTGDKSRKTLCGKVTDKATGETLSGVKIQVKGSDSCCYSDLNGNYVLTISADTKPEILIEGLGYKETTYKADELGFNVNIDLAPLK